MAQRALDASKPDTALEPEPSSSGQSNSRKNENAQEATDNQYDDTSDYLASKIAQTTYRWRDQETLRTERASGDFRRRSQQAVLHVTFTEMRVTELEKELQALRAEIRNLPSDFQISEIKIQCPRYKPILKRSIGEDFRISERSKSIPTRQRPTLEAGYAHGTSPFADESPEKSEAEDNSHEYAIPNGLRIRSWPLISHLERICKENLSSSCCFDRTEGGIEAAPALILRPFKVLVLHEENIRASVSEIQALAEEQERESKQGKKITKGEVSGCEFEYTRLLEDLHLLIKFLNEDLRGTFKLRQQIRDLTISGIEYADLWHLFQLGEVVISKSSRAQAYKIVSFTGGRKPLIHTPRDEKDRVPPVNGFAIDCCSVQFDGSEYVPILHRLRIREYAGRRAICSLDVYPLVFDLEAGRLKEALQFQGRQYRELTCVPFYHRLFRGNTLDETPQDLDAQVIVDTAMALNAMANKRPPEAIGVDDLTADDARETEAPSICEHSYEGCCGSDYVVKDMKMNTSHSNSFRQNYGGLFVPRSAEELNDDIILFPNWVYAFVLRLRQWVVVKMADLHDVIFDNDFNQLMMARTYKETILALVQTHEKVKSAMSTTKGSDMSHSIGSQLDLVKGKGTGLILLLHGEPGVGKTSTAECVADKTRRPLFPITCGDIGETAFDVEKNLHYNFRLAHRWGCVLLLDEADVFLSKRNKNDLRRNAVTSVFLRSLEYYAGILFLTTNRVGGIDPAFKSRIHITVYYPKLDLERTRKLYQVFLDRTKEEQNKAGEPLFKIKDKQIIRFAERHYLELERDEYPTWNGRQIRNAFQTAIALVEHQAVQNGPGGPKPVLGKEQFKIVAEGSKEFDTYLMRTLSGADDVVAVRDEWRNDRFDPSVPVKSKGGQKGSRTVQRRGVLDSSESSSDNDSEDTEGDDTGDDGSEFGEKRTLETSSRGASKGTERSEDLERTFTREELELFEQMSKRKGKAK